MVRSVIILAVVSLLSCALFFGLPSSAFGLPDSDVEQDRLEIIEDSASSESSPLDDFFGDEVDSIEEDLPSDSVSVGDAPVIDSVEPPSIDSSEVVDLSPVRSVVGQPYDGTISATYVDLGRDCLWGLHWFDNYVFWRSGQYQYTFAYGDISFSDGRFSSSSCSILTINAPTSYSGALTVESSSDSLSLNTNGRLVYSDLGDFPSLDSRKYIYDEVMYLAIVALGVHVLGSASSFVLRDSACRDRAAV